MSALLRLMWLGSPALPVGGFSYSEGLEAAVDAGLVHDETSCAVWLGDQLHLGLARSDLPLLAQALRAWQQHDVTRLQALNDWALHSRESAEFRLQAEQMGRSLADWCAQRQGYCTERVHTLRALAGGPSWPIAFALAASESGASTDEAMQAFAFAWCEAMIQAAVKAVPLGQSAGQRLLELLLPQVEPLVAKAIAMADEERQCFTPMLAILSAQHEAQYSRLFRS